MAVLLFILSVVWCFKSTVTVSHFMRQVCFSYFVLQPVEKVGNPFPPLIKGAPLSLLLGAFAFLSPRYVCGACQESLCSQPLQTFFWCFAAQEWFLLYYRVFIVCFLLRCTFTVGIVCRVHPRGGPCSAVIYYPHLLGMRSTCILSIVYLTWCFTLSVWKWVPSFYCSCSVMLSADHEQICRSVWYVPLV